MIWLVLNLAQLVCSRPNLHIGVLVPLDQGLTSLHVLGEEQVLAAKVTQAMINEDPAFKVHVNLSFADSGLDINIPPGDPGSALDESLSYLIDEQEVHGIVGALRSSRSIPTAERCALQGVVQVSHASTSKTLSNRIVYPYFFRVVPNDDYQASGLSSLLKHLEITEVGLVYTTDAYAMQVAQRFAEVFIEQGGTIVPSWDESPHFDVDTGWQNADAVIGDYFSQYKPQYNIFAGMTHDAIAVVRASQKYRPGESVIWFGFDGLTATIIDESSEDVRDSFQKTTGTNIKVANPTNMIYLSFVQKWINLFPDQLPWQDVSSIALSTYTAQIYDSVAIIAKAASNHIDRNPGEPLTREALWIEMKRPQLKIAGIGNTDGQGYVRFDTAAGGQDGYPAYEIQQYQGSAWVDIGDWIYGTGIYLDLDVFKWIETTLPVAASPDNTDYIIESDLVETESGKNDDGTGSSSKSTTIVLIITTSIFAITCGMFLAVKFYSSFILKSEVGMNVPEAKLQLNTNPSKFTEVPSVKRTADEHMAGVPRVPIPQIQNPPPPGNFPPSAENMLHTIPPPSGRLMRDASCRSSLDVVGPMAATTGVYDKEHYVQQYDGSIIVPSAGMGGTPGGENYHRVYIELPDRNNYDSYYVDERVTCGGTMSPGRSSSRASALPTRGISQNNDRQRKINQMSNFEIKDIAIDKSRPFAQGRFGKVFAATYCHAECAVKQVTDLDDYLREGDLFFQASTHPNVCRYFGFTQFHDGTARNNYIVMELFRDRSMLYQMEHGTIFTYTQKVNACKQLSAGILHLHKKGVIHCDIALRNTLIDVKQNRIAITDFGLSRRVGDDRRSKTISPRWSSPELCRSRIFTCETDIYAFGVTTLEILTNGMMPFPGMSCKEVLCTVSQNIRPMINPKMVGDAKYIIDGCLADVHARWKMEDACKHWHQV